MFFPKYSAFFNVALIRQQMSQILSDQPLETRSLLELETELVKLDISEQFVYFGRDIVDLSKY